MKEITRIHIAKTSYDIELIARKHLEMYLKTLEAYNDDAGIISDIEIRITEILTERGVHKNGVISDDDVAALKRQLGEPRDFMGEGDIAIGVEDEGKMSSDATRKLFRNIDNGVAGGVLSGIAAFVGVNPLWIRLLFIVLAIGSFGAALLVYIVLWIIVPPAKTAADKLQMAGRPVTVSSIRELNENDMSKQEGGRMVKSKRMLMAFLGILSALAAAGSAVFVALAIAMIIFGEDGHFIRAGTSAGLYLSAFILGIVSGLLLTTLFIMASYASFTQRITRRVGISMIIVIIAGVATFGTAIGLMQYGSLRSDSAIKANTHEMTLDMPTGSNLINGLTTALPGVHVQYIVSDEAPKATLRMITEDKKAAQNVKMVIEDKTLKISGMQTSSPLCNLVWCDGPYLIIHGPALERIDTTVHKTTVEYSTTAQRKMSIHATEGTDVSITSGTVDSLALDVKNAEVNTTLASIIHLEATIKNSARLEFATVQTLSLSDQGSCSSGDRSSIEMWAVSSGSMKINGIEKPAKTAFTPCTKVVIEGNEE